MYSAVRWVLGVPKYATVGVPAGITRRQWVVAVALAVVALSFLIAWLFWARAEGQSSIVSFQTNLRDQSMSVAEQWTRAREVAAPDPIDTSAFIITPEYLVSSGQEKTFAGQLPEGAFGVVLADDTHIADQLPPLVAPLLRGDGGVLVSPLLTKVLSDSYHHRVTLLAYPEKDSQGQALLKGKGLEMVFSQPDTTGSHVLQWDLQLLAGAQLRAQPLSIGLFLAVFAGLLSSMWPCLFQLTAYFIPTIAGLSMEQIEGKNVAAATRLRVVKTAIFFVLGFAIVYTVIGGVVGYAGSKLGSTVWIDNLRRPISVIAGIAIIYMALRVAVNARAPFVCKMPLGGLHSRKGTGPLGTMLTGLIFASGCMTCFGAALLVGLITYVGSSGSVLLGAGVLALFSLGIGIPLVIAAVAMARILPLLGRLERVAPYLALASSVIMVVFGVMMLTNHLHVLSSLVYKGVPLG